MVFRKNNNDYSPLQVQEIVTKLAASALHEKTAKIVPDEALFSVEKAFDSFAMLEIVMSIEKTFHFHIPDEDIDPDIFYSVKTIASFICDRLMLGD